MRIPFNLLSCQGLPAMGEEINQYLAKKGLPKFWLGGPNLGDGYHISFLAPNGAPRSYPISIRYKPGQPDERVFSRSWRLPMEGPYIKPEPELPQATMLEASPQEAALEPEPEPEPPPEAPAPARRRSTRRPAAAPEPPPELTPEQADE